MHVLTKMEHYVLGAHSIVLISHLGRPKGQVNAKLSLKCVIPVLKELLTPLNISDLKFIENFECSEVLLL